MKFTQDINLLYSKCCEKFMCKNLNIREIQCFVIPLTLAVFFSLSLSLNLGLYFHNLNVEF